MAEEIIKSDYRIFLDDIRTPENAWNYMKNPIYLKLDWEIVRNFQEFVQIIEDRGIPQMVSYDHDLGLEEIWLPLKDYEKSYEVSSFGRIKRKYIIKTKIIKGGKNVSGLTIRMENKKQFYIHRLVAETFIPNPQNKPQVNHIDGNRWNNHIDNLEWVTQNENIKHSHDFLKREYLAYGENHKNSKTISQYDLQGNLINVYGSVHEASRQLNIQFTNIARCGRGERKTAGGFLWKYETKDVTIFSETKYVPKIDKNYKNRFYIPNYIEETGLDCAKHLIKKLEGAEHPDWWVHSANPVGAERIKNVIKDYENKKSTEA